jgi:hypothetical protein
MSEISQATTSALGKMLRPLVKLLIKQGVSYASFSEVMRRLFIDVAQDDFKIPGKKQSLSRISVLTGINRKDVAKILKAEQDTSSKPATIASRPSRIIQGWLRDKRFTNESGAPKPLHFEGGDNSFSELVRLYGGDVTPRSMLDELTRVGVISRNPQQHIVLCSMAYVPQQDLAEKINILGRASGDLFSTLDHNLEHQQFRSRLQRSVAYSNIPVKNLNQIRMQSKEEAEQFLLQINQWLSQHDGNVNPEMQSDQTARAGIGIYYFEQPHQEETIS